MRVRVDVCACAFAHGGSRGDFRVVVDECWGGGVHCEKKPQLNPEGDSTNWFPLF
jgi:hypothetical protein